MLGGFGELRWPPVRDGAGSRWSSLEKHQTSVSESAPRGRCPQAPGAAGWGGEGPAIQETITNTQTATAPQELALPRRIAHAPSYLRHPPCQGAQPPCPRGAPSTKPRRILARPEALATGLPCASSPPCAHLQAESEDPSPRKKPKRPRGAGCPLQDVYLLLEMKGRQREGGKQCSRKFRGPPSCRAAQRP